MVTATELPIDTVREGTTAEMMAETIFGPGVEVMNASYTGDPRSAGIYTDPGGAAGAGTPGESGVILSTGLAEDFTNSSGDANQSGGNSTNTGGPNNVEDFNDAAGTRTYDASYLDVDFKPDSEWMTIELVFASEEYPDFVNSVYQDFMTIWVNGVEIPISTGNGDIDPGNINAGANENLFIDNTSSAVNSEMDGLTLTLSVTLPVVEGEVNSIRIGIADVGDTRYDSSVLIAANSIQTSVVAVEDATNLYPDGEKTIDVLANDLTNTPGTLKITQINGINVLPGGSVVLKSGEKITLNDNGTLTLEGDGDADDFSFTYLAESGGISDTGIVNVSSIPCFVAGTRITTPQGERLVETLQSGDLVLTQDDGPQPIRWIGARTVAAEGRFAPISIAARTFGNHRALVVSPEHRILLQDPLSELLFGEPEVLVAAKYLVDHKSIRQSFGGQVTYFHLMFDRHQVIFSEGLRSESFLPGPQMADSFEQDVRDEICGLFPELDPMTLEGYSASARRTLRRHEAALWRSGALAA